MSNPRSRARWLIAAGLLWLGCGAEPPAASVADAAPETTCGADCDADTGAADAEDDCAARCEALGQLCVQGECVCAPACDLARCAADDGCGGACPPCPAAQSCLDCPLRLSVIATEERGGRVTAFTLALDFAPPEGAPLPRSADLRFRFEGPARLLAVSAGEPIRAADKALVADLETGKPWSELPDGTTRVIVLSTANTNDIAPGRWLTMRLAFTPDAFATPSPLVAALVERQPIFAPPDADAVLLGGGLGAPVVIWP